MYMSDTLNLTNSIWPNGMKVDSDGYAVFYPLGTNKVNVPTSSSEWPKGDKLVSPFVYQEDKLVGFIDTKAFTTDSQTTIYLPYEHIEAEFSAIDKGQLQIHAPNATTKKASWKDSGVEDIPEAQFKYKGCKTVVNVKKVDANYKTTDIVDGTWSEPLWDLTSGEDMFYKCSNLTSFNSALPSLTSGYSMFQNCTNLTSFNSDLSSLTNSQYMFYKCSNLTSFTSDLPSLTDGQSMFMYCHNLKSFSSDLPSLTNGSMMFYDSTLSEFTSDLPSLTNGAEMFRFCANLTSFKSGLSNLSDGNNMFDGCYNLTSFNSDLSSLTNGQGMFSFTKLESFSFDLSSLTSGWGMFYNCPQLTSFSSDLSSLTDAWDMFHECKLDAPSVKNIIDTIKTHSGSLTLGMGCNDTTEDKDLFAQEVGYADMTSLLAALQAKGWTVTTQYNGRPTTTYDLRRPSEDTLPVFVKLEEVEETEKQVDYTSLDDSKKFRLIWFHETTGSTDGYTQFNSLEEVIETLNIKPIERN